MHDGLDTRELNTSEKGVHVAGCVSVSFFNLGCLIKKTGQLMRAVSRIPNIMDRTSKTSPALQGLHRPIIHGCIRESIRRACSHLSTNQWLIDSRHLME